MSPDEAIEAARAHPLAYYALKMERPIGTMHRRLAGQLLSPQDTYEELARGHGKTSGCSTVLEWLLGTFPSLRVKIVGSNDTEASKTSRTVRNGIQSDLFRAVFPSVKLVDGDKSASAWRLSGARSSARDPTVEAMGVMGRAGGRWDILWLDDISDLQNSILKPAERPKVKQSVATTWLPMRDIANPGPIPPRVWKTATPYHTDDITADWRREHGADKTMLRMPCTVVDGRRVSPWPEAFTSDALDAQYAKMGPLAYARAYELVPLSSDMLVFQPEWIQDRLWRTLPMQTELTTVAAVDFAYTAKTAQKSDPDWSVCLIGEIGVDGHLFLTDILRMRGSFTDFRRAAHELMALRGCARGYGEGNGPQSGVVDAFAEGTAIPIIKLDRNKDMLVRATQEQAFVAAGKLHLPGEAGAVRGDFMPLVEEMLTFPAAAHDDALSAMLDLCHAARTGGGYQSASGVNYPTGSWGERYRPHEVLAPTTKPYDYGLGRRR